MLGIPQTVSDESLWIFGYGSLVWRPAFPHLRACPASIEGYARRFWQGSTDHRGTPDLPGRVVTLVPETVKRVEGDGARRDPDARWRCWGTAYQVPLDDPEAVIDGLDHRERGGYERLEVEISLRGESVGPSRVVAGVVYIAGPGNPNYLGTATIGEIALQIARAYGPSGANPEYVFELARSLREMRVADAHVFAVAAEVSRVLAEKENETKELRRR